MKEAKEQINEEVCSLEGFGLFFCHVGWLKCSE